MIYRLTESAKVSLLMRYGSYEPSEVVERIRRKPRHKWSFNEFYFVSKFELHQKIQECKLWLKEQDQVSIPIPDPPLQLPKEISPPRKGDLVHAPDRKHKNGVVLWCSTREDSVGVKFFNDGVEELQLIQFEEWTTIGGRKVWEID